MKPGPPPPHVAAVISVPTLETAIGAVGSFGDLLVPDEASPFSLTIAGRLAALLGAADLDGYARDRPMHLIVLMPPDAGAAPVPVLIVAVGDAARLRAGARGTGLRVQRGWAAIGPRAAVEAVAPWALNELVARPPPRLPTALILPAVIAVSGVAKGARAELDALAAEAAGIDAAIATAGVDTFLDGMVQLERLQLTADASARGIALDVEVHPRAGSNLAAFIAAQRPSRFELFARMPPMAASAYLGGHVAAGPYARRLRWLTSLWLDTVHQESDDAATTALADELVDSATGEVALVQGPTAAGVSDIAAAAAVEPAVAAPVLAGLAARMRAAPRRAYAPEVNARVEVADERIGAATLLRTELRLAMTGATAEQRAVLAGLEVPAFVGLDGAVGLLASGPGARRHVTHMIEAGRGAVRALPPAIGALVDDAQARGDSLIAVMDLAAHAAHTALDTGAPRPGTGDGIWISLGTRGAVLRVHAGASAAQLAAARAWVGLGALEDE